jgi:phage-related protein
MPQTSVRLFRLPNGSVPLLDWLENLENRDKKGHAKCLERILQLESLGNEMRRPASDILRNEIRDLRAKSGRIHYRILYFFCGSHAVCLSHGITKEGRVPDSEIDEAVQRKKLVDRDLEKFTATFEDE